MDSLETRLRAWAEGKTDFAGQKLAELIQQYALIVTTVVSFVAGFATQSLSTTFGILTAGTLAVALITVPSWSFFNRNPQPWLAVQTKGKTE